MMNNNLEEEKILDNQNNIEIKDIDGKKLRNRVYFRQKMDGIKTNDNEFIALIQTDFSEIHELFISHRQHLYCKCSIENVEFDELYKKSLLWISHERIDQTEYFYKNFKLIYSSK